jgi:hypothetical protein
VDPEWNQEEPLKKKSSLNARDQVSNLYKITGKKVLLFLFLCF